MCAVQKRKRSPESESSKLDAVQRPEEHLENDNRTQLVIKLVSVTLCLLFQLLLQDTPKCKKYLGYNSENTVNCRVERKSIKYKEKKTRCLKDLLTFRRILPQSLFTLPVSLTTYFESLSSGNSLSLDESMSNNLLRLSSFCNFPQNVNIFASQLAKAGFYYTGNSDEVRCYACGVTYKNWKTRDNPQDIHRKLSPSCFHMKSLPQSNGQEGVVLSSSLASNYLSNPSLTSNQLTLPSNVSLQTNGSSEVQNLASGFRDNLVVNNSATNRPPILKPSADNLQLNGLTAKNIESEASYAVSNHAENKNVSFGSLSSMGINIDKPKYPNYAPLQVRISSFQGWPSYLDQTPHDMATAGFLFAGYHDYTRCFFCGGGLRNWEAGDDPWVEHARWFPKCAYLRQNKGDSFVNAVQKKQQQLLTTATETAAPLNSSPKVQINSHLDTVAARSVLEMGYSKDEVLDAIKQVTSASDNTEVSATVILSALLHDKDDNKTRTASKSALSAGKTNMTETSSLTNEMYDVTSSLSNSKLDDTETLLEENRQLKDQRLCKICLDLEASIAFLPCGHLVCCAECAPAMRKCPICRVFVKGTVKTFLI